MINSHSKNIQTRLNHQAGFSLLDVLVAITIVVIGISTLVALSSVIARNQRRSSERAEAVKYSQETMEWFRVIRQRLSWGAFYSALEQDGSPGVYCLPTFPQETGAFTALPNQECSLLDVEDQIPTTPFVRELRYELGVDTITATSVVRWRDGTNDLQTETSAVFRRWVE